MIFIPYSSVGLSQNQPSSSGKLVIDLPEPINGETLSFVTKEEDACCDEKNPYPFSSNRPLSQEGESENRHEN